MNDRRSLREQALDDTIEQTFPASDPPANTVAIGIRLDPGETLEQVVNNRTAHRFELATDGGVAFLTYERRRDALLFLHTEVPPAVRGRGLGTQLVKGALAAATNEGLSVVAVCPFVKAYLQKPPQSASE